MSRIGFCPTLNMKVHSHALHSHSLIHSLRSAFTMIEMITTVSLLAVVSAITVPALQGVTSSSSLSVAAREFSNLLTQARSEAIARHTVVRLAVETYNETSNIALRRVSLWE